MEVAVALLVVAVALAGRMVVEAMLFLAPQQCLLFIHVSISLKKTLYCNQVAGHFRLMGGLIFTRLVDFSPPFD